MEAKQASASSHLPLAFGLQADGTPRREAPLLSRDQDIKHFSWDEVVICAGNPIVMRRTQLRRTDTLRVCGSAVFSMTIWRRLQPGCLARPLRGGSDIAWQRFSNVAAAAAALQDA